MDESNRIDIFELHTFTSMKPLRRCSRLKWSQVMCHAQKPFVA